MVPLAAGATGEAVVARMWKDFHRVHMETFGFHYEGRQEVEVGEPAGEAVGPGAQARGQGDGADGAGAGAIAEREVLLARQGVVRVPIYSRDDIMGGFRSPVRGSSRSTARRSWFPTAGARADDYGNLIFGEAGMTAATQDRGDKPALGPIELEVITGTIRTAELEIEAAVERTARSPMIRDQHDYRVALFDARGRKLTGVLLRRWSSRCRVFRRRRHPSRRHLFWNDPSTWAASATYPTCAPPVPIFHGGPLIGFSQVFAITMTSAGRPPVACRRTPPTCGPRAGGAADQDLRTRCGHRGGVQDHLPQLAAVEHLRGDLDAEIGAARLGSDRVVAMAERYGVEALEAAYDWMIENCAATIRRELLPKIRDGVYRWRTTSRTTASKGRRCMPCASP